jgi:invasion protein IalB
MMGRPLLIGLLVMAVFVVGVVLIGTGPRLFSDRVALVSGSVPVSPSASDLDKGPPSSDWSRRCEPDGKQCEIFQRLVVSQTNQVLLEMAISFPGNAQSGIIAAILPLASRLAPGVELTIADPAATLRLDYLMCHKNGCYASAVLSDKMLAGLKKSETLQVLFVDSENKRTRVDVSLKGLAEKLKTL